MSIHFENVNRYVDNLDEDARAFILKRILFLHSLENKKSLEADLNFVMWCVNDFNEKFQKVRG